MEREDLHYLSISQRIMGIGASQWDMRQVTVVEQRLLGSRCDLLIMRSQDTWAG